MSTVIVDVDHSWLVVVHCHQCHVRSDWIHTGTSASKLQWMLVGSCAYFCLFFFVSHIWYKLVAVAWLEAVSWALSLSCRSAPTSLVIAVTSPKTGLSDKSILAVKCSNCHNGAEWLYITYWSGHCGQWFLENEEAAFLMLYFAVFDSG